MNRKPFLVDLAELIVAHWPQLNPERRRWLRRLLPSPGNAIFTLLVVAGLLWASNAGALPLRSTKYAVSSSTGTIAYQGRLADSAGTPLTGTYNMIFRLYDVAAGGTHLWEEQWTGSNGVQVSDGLFNVMLGSLTPIQQDVITGHDTLWLGITVGTDDEMTPRVQLGSVPFAVQALTMPDGNSTITRSIWFPATFLNIVNGSPSRVSSDSLGSYWALDDSSTESVGAVIHVPDDYDDGNLIVKAWYTQRDSNPGNVVLGFRAGIAKANGQSDVLRGVIVEHVTSAAPGTQGEVKVERVKIYNPGAANRVWAFSIGRHGSDDSDTKSGDVWLLGLEIEYTVKR